MAKYSASVRVGQLLLEAREIGNNGRVILRHSSIIGPSRKLRESRCRSPVKTKSSYLIKVSKNVLLRFCAYFFSSLFLLYRRRTHSLDAYQRKIAVIQTVRIIST